MKRSSLKLLIDIGMTVAVIPLMEPHATGLNLHERGGLLICVAFLVHALLNWKWIARITANFLKKLPFSSRVNYALNVLLVVGFFLTVLSGIAIAKTINFAWLSLPGSWPFWRSMHVFASMLTLLAVGAHVGLHWKWVVYHCKKVFPVKERSRIHKNTQEVSHG